MRSGVLKFTLIVFIGILCPSQEGLTNGMKMEMRQELRDQDPETLNRVDTLGPLSDDYQSRFKKLLGATTFEQALKDSLIPIRIWENKVAKKLGAQYILTDEDKSFLVVRGYMPNDKSAHAVYLEEFDVIIIRGDLIPMVVVHENVHGIFSRISFGIDLPVGNLFRFFDECFNFILEEKRYSSDPRMEKFHSPNLFSHSFWSTINEFDQDIDFLIKKFKGDHTKVREVISRIIDGYQKALPDLYQGDPLSEVMRLAQERIEKIAIQNPSVLEKSVGNNIIGLLIPLMKASFERMGWQETSETARAVFQNVDLAQQRIAISDTALQAYFNAAIVTALEQSGAKPLDTLYAIFPNSKIETLLKRASDAADSTVRRAAIRLFPTDTQDPEMIVLIIRKLSDTDENVCKVAEEIIHYGKVSFDPANIHSAVKEALLEHFACGSRNARLRVSEVISAFSEEPQVRKRLLEILNNPKSPAHDYHVVDALLPAIRRDAKLREEVVANIKSYNADVQRSVEEEVFPDMPLEGSVRTILLAGLSDPDRFMGLRAKKVLSNHISDPVVRSGFNKRLRFRYASNDRDREWIAQLLKPFVAEDPDTRLAFIEQLKHEEICRIQTILVDALEPFIGETMVQEALLNVLNITKDEQEQARLDEQDPKSPEASRSKRDFISPRVRVIQLLTSYTVSSPSVRTFFMKKMAQETDPDIVDSFFKALASCVGFRDVRDTFLDILKRQHGSYGDDTAKRIITLLAPYTPETVLLNAQRGLGRWFDRWIHENCQRVPFWEQSHKDTGMTRAEWLIRNSEKSSQQLAEELETTAQVVAGKRAWMRRKGQISPSRSDSGSVINPAYALSEFGKNYGRSFGIFFVGSEVGHLISDTIISGIDERFKNIEEAFSRLSDWKTHVEFGGFSLVAVGTEQFLDQKILSLFRPEELPYLKYFAKNGVAMAFAMEVTALSRELLENPSQWNEILDRHLSLENMVHLAGVTTSFLMSRSVVQGAVKIAQGIRYGSKAASLTPPGLAGALAQEVGVFALVGLSEHYLLPPLDQAMLQGKIFELMSIAKDHIISTHPRDNFTETDLTNLEDTFQYMTQFYMQNYIKEIQKMQKELQGLEKESGVDPRIIRAQIEHIERINQDPTSDVKMISDYGQIQESFLKTLSPELAQKYSQSYMSTKIQEFMKKWIEKKQALETEISFQMQRLNNSRPDQYLIAQWFDFPKNLSEVFIIQEKCLAELEKEAEGNPAYLDLIEKAKLRLYTRKMILIQILKNIAN